MRFRFRIGRIEQAQLDLFGVSPNTVRNSRRGRPTWRPTDMVARARFSFRLLRGIVAFDWMVLWSGLQSRKWLVEMVHTDSLA